MEKGSITVVQGVQWGDEGKGKIADEVTADAHLVARFGGGKNAGHVRVVDGVELVTHQIPDSLDRENVEMAIIGNGGFLDPEALLKEINEHEQQGVAVTPEHLAISTQIHLVLPHQILRDRSREAGSGAQGSTKSGIPFAAADKGERVGVRAGMLDVTPLKVREVVIAELMKFNKKELQEVAGFEPVNYIQVADEWMENAIKIIPYLKDTPVLLTTALQNGKRVVAVGAQAFGLDIDHGDYPDVTSSATTALGVSQGLGVSPFYIERILSVIKALPSRVGGETLVTKIMDQQLAELIKGERGGVDSEYGKTTGRERAVGFLDLVQINRAMLLTGSREAALTKADRLEALRSLGHIPVATAYRLQGKEITIAPEMGEALRECEPVYEHFPLWEGSIAGISKWSQLPKELRTLVRFIEQRLGIQIVMIGTGPERGQTAIKTAVF